MATSTHRVPTFVTAATDKYFFMCGILLQSLKKYFPGLKCFVMDIGLSGPQKEFFASKGILLRIPPTLSESDHPYKLKSNMGSFLDQRVEGTPIWIDSDMMAVAPGKESLLSLLNRSSPRNACFAMCPDEGPCKTIEEFLTVFPAPLFLNNVAARPDLKAQRYLNAGFIIFLNRDVLTEYRDLSATMETDTCSDQNALNMMGYDRDRVFVLESRIWNAHAGLLKKLSVQNGKIFCDGQRTIFVHAASVMPGDVRDSTGTIVKDEYRTQAFLKIFANEAVRTLQQKFLEQFIAKNVRDFRDLGILRRPLPTFNQ
jgi:hypothetical protein